MSGKSQPSETAKQDWMKANKIQTTSTVDELFRYHAKEQQDLLKKKEWQSDVHYFQELKISALALLKMVMHARSGGRLEVMGMLQGKLLGSTMVCMDVFALPVEGTETRVNALDSAYEYMSQYFTFSKEVSRPENCIGWYHSHPGYGCWLSGIDVSTQFTNQMYQEPFVAIVIDPTRTAASGKVHLGAFRTYPEDYSPKEDAQSEYQSIPFEKIEDFGIHCKRYYPLNVSYFKSSLDSKLLDQLWNKYWVSTLTTNPLVANEEYSSIQISDMSEKLEQIEQVERSYMHGGVRSKEGAGKLEKATKDSSKLSIEAIQGLMSQVLKNQIFSGIPI
ncbi:COP9 signalosome complex subunit 5 [Oopsacas minuta]|uniref:COP9 signalosome complex subunit 5 n=1 Tax=Oopsacas minuta TaxID=111878 RepID=A0AAV7KJP2_9METZ|nr:COP9 signalosome complex subunit 5 [Oopsacas minuta]